MNFIATQLPGVIVVEPDLFRDARGFFLESWNLRKYQAGGINASFVQTNHSLSQRGTLRGLHAQLTKPQGKLLRCVEGAIFDVAVDIWPSSPTFKRWVGVELTAENFRQLYVPPGYAHGFAVTSERAQVEYASTEFYFPEDEIAIAWNDPGIGIVWPVSEPLLSARDAAALPLSHWIDRLPQRP